MLGQFRSWILLIVISISWVKQAFVLGVEDETFKAHFPTAWASEITPLCYNDSQSYLQSYLNGEKWAFESIIFGKCVQHYDMQSINKPCLYDAQCTRRQA